VSTAGNIEPQNTANASASLNNTSSPSAAEILPGNTASVKASFPAAFSLSIFVIALLLRCAYNFYIPHVNNFASCDAYEYIQNGQALLNLFKQPAEFWQKSISCLAGSGSSTDWASVKAGLVPLKDFYISGPVFPAFLAIIAAITGGVASQSIHFLWPQLLFGNSVVSALTCVFIALTAKECFGKRTGILAGILAAVYPAFIVNSGRLYSETFAAFLLTALSYITIRGFRKQQFDASASMDPAASSVGSNTPGNGNNLWLVFLSGFLAAALQLTRSVMFVLTLALLPITAVQQKGWRRLTFLLPFALGFALIALPWLGFQKLAFGGGGLVVDRVGHYNFFIGNNVDTQGWLTYPYPDGRNVENTSFPDLLCTAIKKSPSRWVRLMLDKPLRLFKFPWNDHRTAIGFVEFKWQVLFHELIVMFACFGLALNLFLSRFRAASKPEFYGRVFLAGLLAFHCIYGLFITVPRYNLCAMPEMIIFAAASITLLAQLLNDRGTRTNGLLFLGSTLLLLFASRTNMLPFLMAAGLKPQLSWSIEAAMRVAALIACSASLIAVSKVLIGQEKIARALTVLMALCMVPLLVIPLRANGRTFEWQHSISLSSAAVKQDLQIPLDAARKSRNGLYLLVDTSAVRQIADGLSISVNGERLAGPVLPSMSFAENFDRFIDLDAGNVQREGERMWDSLASSADRDNLQLRQWSMILLPQELVARAVERAEEEGADKAKFHVNISNHSPLPVQLYGSYNTGKDRILPSVDVYSWEKVFYGVENSEGLTDTRYDIKIPAQTLVCSDKDLSEEPGLQNGSFNMALLAAPAANLNFQPRALARIPLGSTRTDQQNGKSIPVPLFDLPRSSNSIWIVELKGRSRVISGDPCPAADLSICYSTAEHKPFIYRSSWSPRALSDSHEWKDFEFAVPVKPIIEKGAAREAQIGLRQATKESPYLNLQHWCHGEVEFADVVLNIYVIPSNPIGLGHRVY
jgi:4-amino-4-deoxy-L-arabinose transferase-like glycosyltransferase